MLDKYILKIQKYVCKLINIIGNISLKIEKSSRNQLLIFSFLLICVMSFFYTIIPIYVHLLYKCIIGAFILFLILLFSIDRDIKPIKWEKKIYIPWFGFGLLQFMTSIIVSIEYLPMTCIWLIGFPCLFLIWNNRGDYEKLFESAYKGFLYPTMLFYILSLVFKPIQNAAYTGLTSNTNALALHVITIFPMAFYRAFFRKHKRFINIDLICVILSIVFIILSRSRTGTLAVLVVMVFSLIYYFYKKIKKRNYKKIIISLGAIIITTIILGIIVNNVNLNKEENDIYLFSILRQNIEENNIINGYFNRLLGTNNSEKGIDSYSSGRVGIWMEAIEEINIQGHASRCHIIVKSHDFGNNIHNTFLQFVYDNGIFAGSLYIILVILSILKTFIQIIRNNEKKQLYIQIFLIEIAYFATSLVTSVNLPFLYTISFIYYLVYSVLFEKKKEMREDGI